MNLKPCHIFSKKINYVVILKCPKSILEYYFSKGLATLECNVDNVSKSQNGVKQRIHAKETDNPDKVMT